jgi:acyl-CoA dehydrogenase
MDPRCKVLLVMGKNDAANPDTYRQQSVLIVPLPYPGVKVIRYTKVMGYDVFP